MPKLGTMTKVDIKAVWGDERAFCTWLANDGLSQLDDLLELSLEDVEEQVAVGRYIADIVCTDVSDADRPAKAVIEVQLGASDHGHLGQVLTYAAGLDDTDPEFKHALRHAIWVAEEFTGEHVQALDWINAYFGHSTYVYGIVANIRRIGDCDPAVELNAVSAPNRERRRRNGDGEITVLQQEHLDFWTQYVEGFPLHMSNLSPKKPGKWHYMDFAIGFGTKAQLSVNRIARDGLIRVQLVLGNSSQTGWYDALNSQRSAIEKEMDTKLEWKPRDGTKDKAVIQVVSQADTSDRSGWPNQMQWMYDHLERFDSVFRKRLPPNRSVDASRQN